MPAVLNAANEVAVAAFLAGRLRFPAIAATIARTLEGWQVRNRPLGSLEQAEAVDGEARALASRLIEKE
jgi:1-deoxy-D-xylulose-5-phosphate reductoisomerase